MRKEKPTNRIILAPLRLLDDDEIALSKATLIEVGQVYGTNALQLKDADFVKGLATKWLQGNHEEHLSADRSKLLSWPRDAEQLIQIIAALMTLQSTRKADRERSSKQPAPKVKELEMWPPQHSKRICTEKDVEQRGSESLADSTILSDSDPSSRTCSERLRSASIPDPEKNTDKDADYDQPSTKIVLKYSIEQGTRLGPLKRVGEQCQASISHDQAFVDTAVSSPSLEPRLRPAHTPVSIPPFPIEHKRRAISEGTDDSTDEIGFKVDCNGKTYEIPGEKCANVLQLTLSLLEQMRADLRVAMLQRKALDNQTKVAHILGQIEEALKQ